jgi:HD-like signal output (HDOD) protein
MMERILPSVQRIGINHAIISGKAAEQLNFPEEISTAIRFYHRPDLIEDNQAVFPWLIYFRSRSVR